MKFLTIDASTGVIVGVCDSELGEVQELAVAHSEDARHHAESLSPLISQVLGEAGVQKPDAIIVGTGPGAFTGLRAGLVTARTLARAWDVPIYGLSSLEVLALAAADAGANIIVPIIDARRREVFTLRARAMGGDDVEILADVSVIAPAELNEQLRRDPAIVASVSDALYPDLPGERLTVAAQPTVMVRLLQSRLARREAGEELDLGTEPQYLRRPDVHGGAHAQPAATSNPYGENN